MPREKAPNTERLQKEIEAVLSASGESLQYKASQLNRGEAAALAGLAPFNHDSGSIRGKRAIFGGRRALRSGLYMAALSAARYNPILSSFYQRLRAKGKPHKLALTAVMRKLLLALNSSLKPQPILA